MIASKIAACLEDAQQGRNINRMNNKAGKPSALIEMMACLNVFFSRNLITQKSFFLLKILSIPGTHILHPELPAKENRPARTEVLH